MPEINIPIANGFYKSDSLPVSAQECINWYPVINEAPALSPEILRGIPGVSLLGTTGNKLADSSRGLHIMAGVPYFVNGGFLYKMAADYTITNLGVISGTARVSMSDNGTQLMVLIPGGLGYIYNHVSGAFVQITDTDFTANGAPQYVTFVDSYFVVTTDSKKFICSSPNDGTNWNALDFGSAESDPDDTVAPMVHRNQLFIGGGETLEGFQNIGGTDFPFQRSGIFIDKGVKAPFSVVNTPDSVAFVGGGANESPAVWVLQGSQVNKISTIPIDSILQDLTEAEVAAIHSWAYAQNGAYFVGFTLPQSTIVYDFTSSRWHERKSYIDSAEVSYRVAGLAQAYNIVICTDSIDGRIGRLDPDVYTEYGDLIIRTVVTQPFQNNGLSIFVASLELTVESGVGNSAFKNPAMTLERSNDGKTWSEPLSRFIGKVGEYSKRAIWRRLGRVARFELFRFKLSAPVKPVVIQATANITSGTR